MDKQDSTLNQIIKIMPSKNKSNINAIFEKYDEKNSKKLLSKSQINLELLNEINDLLNKENNKAEKIEKLEDRKHIEEEKNKKEEEEKSKKEKEKNKKEEDINKKEEKNRQIIVESENQQNEEGKNEVKKSIEKEVKMKLDKEKINLQTEKMETENLQIELKTKENQKEEERKNDIIDKKEKSEDKNEEIKTIESNKNEIIQKNENDEIEKEGKKDKKSKDETNEMGKNSVEKIENLKPSQLPKIETEKKDQNLNYAQDNITSDEFMEQFIKPNDDNSKELLEIIQNVINDEPNQVKIFQKKINEDEKNIKEVKFNENEENNDSKKVIINNNESKNKIYGQLESMLKTQKNSNFQLEDKKTEQIEDKDKELPKNNEEMMNLDKLSQKDHKNNKIKEFNSLNDYNDIQGNQNLVDFLLQDNQDEKNGSNIELSIKEEDSTILKKKSQNFIISKLYENESENIEEEGLKEEKGFKKENKGDKKDIVISEINLSDSEGIVEITNEETNNNNYIINKDNELYEELNENNPKKYGNVSQIGEFNSKYYRKTVNKTLICNLLSSLIDYYGHEDIINCIIKIDDNYNKKLNDFIEYLLRYNSLKDIIYCLIKCKSVNEQINYDSSNDINQESISNSININNQYNKDISINSLSITEDNFIQKRRNRQKNVLRQPFQRPRKRNKYRNNSRRTKEKDLVQILISDDIEEDILSIDEGSIYDIENCRIDKNNELKTSLLGKKRTNNLIDFHPENYGIHYHKEEDGLIFKYEFRKLKGKNMAIYECSEIMCSSKAVLYTNREEFRVLTMHSNYDIHKNWINKMINDKIVNFMNKKGFIDLQMTEKNRKKKIEWIK